jgi:hypothetical protein
MPRNSEKPEFIVSTININFKVQESHTTKNGKRTNSLKYATAIDKFYNTTGN